MRDTAGSHFHIPVLPIAICLTLTVLPVAAADAPNVSPFPTRGLLPKEETGALRFLKQYPQYDGRGITVAIFDTGVDPGAAGLTTTSTGEPKIVDLIDATGDGDVKMSGEHTAEDNSLSGLTGRTLTLNPNWKNPSGTFRLGLLRAWQLFPKKLVERRTKERREDWDRRQTARTAALQQQLITWDADHLQPSATELTQRDELQARIDDLAEAKKHYEDPGPICDCVTWNDGSDWRAAVDTDEDGGFADEIALTGYRIERQYAEFSEASQLSFSVNIHDDGTLLSVVTVSGNHGTHVAGIVAAHEPERPERNGIAPGAQIVSIKIGDNRVERMETGRAITRALRAVIDHHCDLVNMSYGEPSSIPDGGRLPDLMSELVREHGVIFVSSAGNSGPALSTVGAPGGTSEALLGIGAYVSPAMMSPQYGLREKLPGMPYNWTSRGPTTDGATGIDLFAPGGAFAPVSRYSLQNTMQMNGTSMASPNACGNIALLLSGLKGQDIPYTPALIRRALQNTAQTLPDIDRFTQGVGLLQTDTAWKWLEQHTDDAERFAFDVETDSNGGRGILLRESEDVAKPFRTRVLVTPRFRRDEAKQTQVAFELPVTLETTADWIDVGDVMLLTSAGERFNLRIDPTQLPAGAHQEEVRGYRAGHENRGPLFTVPVTVIRPEAVVNETTTTVVMNAGETQRRFLTVPDGATWADIALTLRDAEARRTFILHTVQTLPGHSFEDHERRDYVKPEPGERTIVSMPVVDGRTLEVCLAQYWTYVGPSTIEMDVTFRGLAPDDNDLTVPSDGSPLEIIVASRVRRERCRPRGSFKTLRRLLRPVSLSRTPLLSPRERQLNGGPTFRIIAEYSFTLQDDGDVTICVPELDGLLYDSPLDSHAWQLFDANNQLLATDDMYPETIALQKGGYTLTLELRHSDPNVLKRFESVVVTVDGQLDKPIAIDCYASRTDAVVKSDEFPSTWLDRGETASIFAGAPTNHTPQGPLTAQTGDILVGAITFVDMPDEDQGANRRPGGFPLRFVIPPDPTNDDSKPAPTDKDETPLEEQLADDLITQRIEQIGQLQWPRDRDVFEKLAAGIVSDAPDAPDAQQRLLAAKLKLIDGDNRKDHLVDVITAADAVIDTIRPNVIARRLAQRPDPENPNDVDKHRDAEKQRDILVDALYRKGRALAYRELPDVVEKHPIEDQAALNREFKSNFRKLARQVDTTNPKYALLHIRRDRRTKRYGLALKQLNRLAAQSTPSKWLHHKKRRDLYELLGWDDWREYEHKQMLICFPDHKP